MKQTLFILIVLLFILGSCSIIERTEESKFEVTYPDIVGQWKEITPEGKTQYHIFFQFLEYNFLSDTANWWGEYYLEYIPYNTLLHIFNSFFGDTYYAGIIDGNLVLTGYNGEIRILYRNEK